MDTKQSKEFECTQRSCPDFIECQLRFDEMGKDWCSLRTSLAGCTEDGIDFGCIDVIIPTYQCGNYLEAAVESVRNQTFPQDRIHITIVDDGSTDNTYEVVKSLMKPGDTRFSYIKLKTNGGANAARNKAFKATKGEWVFFMDADSVLKKRALEELAKVLDVAYMSRVAYSYGSFNQVFVVESQVGVDIARINFFNVGEFNPQFLREGNYISMMSLIQRSALASVGCLDENIRRLQDWDMWLTLLDNDYIGKRIPTDYVLFDAYVRPTGASGYASDVDYSSSVLAVRNKHRR
jgi:glycosyltransferase involved in cell wall biosynthesis